MSLKMASARTTRNMKQRTMRHIRAPFLLEPKGHLKDAMCSALKVL